MADRAREAFNNKTVVPVDVEKKEIIAVSTLAGFHEKFMLDVIRGHDYVDRFLDYNDDETSAAFVLLRAIENGLRMGILDTKALGELVEDQEICISPESTHVTKVTTDNMMGVVEFFFDVLNRRGLWERVIWINLIGVIIFSIVAAALVGGGTWYWRNNR